MSAEAGASGVFSGYGSVFGFLDRQREIVDRGAFAGTLAAFRKSGFVTWMHDQTRPVAYPLEIREDSYGLYLRAAFHSTPDAQAARTILAERDAAGLKFGLSIGYKVVSDTFDSKGFRHLKAVELFEIGLVSIPANEISTVSPGTVKGMLVGPPVELATRPGSDGSRRAPRDEVLRIMGEAAAVGVRLSPPAGSASDGSRRASREELLRAAGEARANGINIPWPR